MQPDQMSARGDVQKGGRTIRDFVLLAMLTGAACQPSIDALGRREPTAGDVENPETKAGGSLTVHLPPQAVLLLKHRHENRNDSASAFGADSAPE
jgi:hypothetical protein